MCWFGETPCIFCVTPSFLKGLPDIQREIHADDLLRMNLYALFHQGEAAKNQVGTNPENTLYDVKRLIGRSFRDSHVQKDVKSFPFAVRHVPHLRSVASQHDPRICCSSILCIT
jgi:hypothetical protein